MPRIQRALPIRGAEGARKIFAGGQQLRPHAVPVPHAPARARLAARIGGRRRALADRKAHERLAHAQLVQAEAEVVVLRERAGVERRIAAHLHHGLDGAPAVAQRHARAGHGAGQRLARHQVFLVGLAEIVHVGAGHPLVPLALQRQHGQLHQVLVADEVVEVLQLQRVDHVFAVVHDHAREADAVPRLVAHDGLDDGVQAVRLAGRAIVRDGGAHHPAGIAAHHAVDLGGGLGIVAVGAGEDDVAGVLHRRQGVLHHLGDDVVFLPGRHHDGEVALLALAQRLRGNGGGQAARAAPQPELAHPVEGIQEEVVGGADENDERRRHGHRVEQRQVGLPHRVTHDASRLPAPERYA